MGGALNNLTLPKVSLLTAGGLNEMTFKDPSQPKLFHDSHVCQGLDEWEMPQAEKPFIWGGLHVFTCLSLTC